MRRALQSRKSPRLHMIRSVISVYKSHHQLMTEWLYFHVLHFCSVAVILCWLRATCIFNPYRLYAASVILRGLIGVLCAIICPLILTLDPCRGPIGDLKTWIDIPNVGQKGVIQDGVQDGRRTLTFNITPSAIFASVLEWWILCLYLGFWCQGIHWNHFRVKKVAGKGEFQDRPQNGYRALSASLWRFIIEPGE